MPDKLMIEVTDARTPAEFAEGKTLITEYAATLAIDLYFQHFANEVSSLHIMYGPPSGYLLLARRRSELLGCVGVRRLNQTVCEMKRLYIRPPYRGMGLGRCLAKAAIARARQCGYQRMVLDTLPSMVSAQALYESLGFRPTERYYVNPVEGTRYLALDIVTQ